jgi:hypothetical protein
MFIFRLKNVQILGKNSEYFLKISKNTTKKEKKGNDGPAQ